MTAAAPLLLSDPTLLCVSAWNDNSKPEHVADAAALHRTDFFPGLGWQLSRATWSELASKWPTAFWDDWLRRDAQRRGRACVRPEVSRVRVYCEKAGGASRGQFCDAISKAMHHAGQVSWTPEMVADKVGSPQYDRRFESELAAAADAASAAQASKLAKAGAKSVRITYTTPTMMRKLLKEFGLMDDRPAGDVPVARTEYRGAVFFRHHGATVYIASPTPRPAATLV
eukprot:TRINITY_DN10901_c0_g3_i2.p2 TRINITY_DN10901_c0_g3~~TRINITY_DN10901_c0_g3_i2.p2  ORF type:complete len:227 (+),score=77.87 TRINITY_DN10901_c0_g3_i2:612-1292(+)